MRPLVYSGCAEKPAGGVCVGEARARAWVFAGVNVCVQMCVLRQAGGAGAGGPRAVRHCAQTPQQGVHLHTPILRHGFLLLLSRTHPHSAPLPILHGSKVAAVMAAPTRDKGKEDIGQVEQPVFVKGVPDHHAVALVRRAAVEQHQAGHKPGAGGHRGMRVCVCVCGCSGVCAGVHSCMCVRLGVCVERHADGPDCEGVAAEAEGHPSMHHHQHALPPPLFPPSPPPPQTHLNCANA